MDGSAWLGDGEVLAHIGAHKTGSSAVQAAFSTHRQALRKRGVMYPGSSRSQYGAGLQAVGRTRGWDPVEPGKQTWERLAKQIAATDEKVVISAESLTDARPDQVPRIVKDLGGSRTRIVITLRPLELVIPSAWQQSVKSGLRIPYRKWMKDIIKGPAQSKRTPAFWVRHDHGALVERWAEVVGADRLTAVVLGANRKLDVLEVFEDLIGLERGTLRSPPDARTNRSLSAAEIEAIRRLNEWARGSLRHTTYHRLLREGAVEALVENRSPGPDERKMYVPQGAIERVRDFGLEAASRIDATGVNVVGDLKDLSPTGSVSQDELPEPEEVPIDAAAMLLRGVLSFADQLIDWEQPGVAERAAEIAVSGLVQTLTADAMPAE
ncbi:hypothetical protein BH24ACT6_BH24ACT6_16900 [soil metagenome]